MTESFLGGYDVGKFSNMEDRKGFVRKVYAILGMQLLITAAITLIPCYNIKAAVWINTH